MLIRRSRKKAIMNNTLKRQLGWLATPKGKGAGFSLLSIGKMLAAVFMYLKQVLIANYFGLSWETDAYAVALIIPQLVTHVITTSLNSCFIPILADVTHKKGKAAANRLISHIVLWALFIGTILICILFFSGNAIVSSVGPGLSEDAWQLGGLMLKIMLPLLILSSINGILLGFLTYQERYGLRALIALLQVIVALGVIIGGHAVFGILSLPLSAVISVAFSFFLLAFLTAKTGFVLSFSIDPKEEDFRRFLFMAFPIMLSVVFNFLGPVVDKMLSSLLSVDSVTALSYADRLKQMVLSVLFLPLAAIANVTFSKQASEGNLSVLRKEMTRQLNWTSLFMFPVAITLTLLATPVIACLFQRGEFTAEDSGRVGYALVFYAPWLAQFGLGMMASRMFYALKDTITPVLISAWGLIVNILLSIILFEPLGIGGLALGTTLASTAKTTLLFYFLRKKMGHINGKELFREQLKLLCASALMTGVIFLAPVLFSFEFGSLLTFSERALRLFAVVLPAGMAYVTTAILLKSRVALSAVSTIKNKFSRS